MSVRMCKRMQGIVLIHTEMIRRDKNRSTGSQRNITHIIPNGSGSHSRCRIVSGSRRYHYIVRQSQCVCHLRQYAAHLFIAFIAGCQLIFAHAADLTHFLRPAAVLYIKQEHTGGIRYIRTMYAGQTIRNVILRKHDLFDPCKILRFILFHPKDLRCGKTGKGDIRGILRQFLLADHVVQVVTFLGGSAVIPKNRRADHLILLIQDDQSMHLSTEADACHLILVCIF